MTITLSTFLLGLMISSTFTGLVTQAIKTLVEEHEKTIHPNTLSAIVSIILSAILGVGYVILNSGVFNAQVIIYILALTFMSWLAAMVGYDKIAQAIAQFKEFKG